MAAFDPSDQGEGFDFVCTVCEGGNGGQICETCHDRIIPFKRWLVATETMPKGQSRFIVCRKDTDEVPDRMIVYSREGAEAVFDRLGEDGEVYEVREIKVALL